MQTLIESTPHFQLSYSFGAINGDTTVSTSLAVGHQISKHHDNPVMTRLVMVRDERSFTPIKNIKDK
jgi:hypothetical protein